MAIYDAGTASLAASGVVTGVGTTWMAPLTLIRVGATIVFKTEPVKIYTISEIISDTQINVYNPKSETVPAGTGYAILAHDGITVQGLAQDVAETLRYYQSRETEVADAVDAFNNFDANDFNTKVTQVNTQYGDVVAIGAQVSSDATQVSYDKAAAAASAASASADKDAAAASAQEAADYAASLDTSNLLRKDLNFSDVADKYVAVANLDLYTKAQSETAYVTPAMFGGDVQSAIDAAAAAGKGLLGDGAVHETATGFIIKKGLKFIKNLKVKATAAITVIKNDDANSGYSCDIIDNEIDMNEVGNTAILLYGISKSNVSGNKILNCKASPSTGIRLGVIYGSHICSNVNITNNIVEMGQDPDNGTGSVTMNGISLIGIPYNNSGGLDEDGKPKWHATPTIQKVNVSCNHVTGGTHNIVAQGCFRVEITNNQLEGAAHRNINVSPNSQRMIIDSNMLFEAGSSAININVANRWVRVSNNYIQSTSASAVSSDDAAIQANTYAEGIDIVNNTILGDWKYCIKMSEAIGCNVIGNTMNQGGSVANIYIENTWLDTIPTGAIYSKSHSRSYSVNASTSMININSNIHGGRGAAIAIAQFGDTKSIRLISMVGESISSSNAHAVHLFCETKGLVSDLSMNSISADGAGIAKYHMPFGKTNFTFIDNVMGITNTRSDVTTATFHLTGQRIFSLASTTPVTNITGAKESDVVTLRAGVIGATVVHDLSKIRLKGSANWVSASTLEIITLQYIGGIWFEVSRSF